MIEIMGMMGILVLLLIYFTLCYQRTFGKRLQMEDLIKGAIAFMGNPFLMTVIYLLLVAVMILVGIVAGW